MFIEFGPQYSHLGVGNNNEEIAKQIGQQMDISSNDVKVISILYCKKEAIDIFGCPVGEFLFNC